MQGFHGYGFASVLMFLQIIPNGSVDFPVVIFQLLTVVPLLYFLFRKFGDNIELSSVSFCSALTLLVFMYFSRYLHGNFVGFIMFWPVLAWALQQQESVK